jgi:UTP-glucose-1-phosphate uridylyltransferase
MAATLVILAAGMGSRYGGLKQVDPVGPNGETILDYSVYDALQAGVDRLVFVIRREMEAEFRRAIGDRYSNRVAVAYAFQELTDLPHPFSAPADRVKPWGTGHAVRAARAVVDAPMIVINADDFYGAAAYHALTRFLQQPPTEPGLSSYAMAGFRLRNTLSDHGHVSRGLCACDAGHRLQTVVEHTHIEQRDDAIVSLDADGTATPLTGDEWVSMNMWAFQPDLFAHLEARFTAFLQTQGGETKSEFYLPAAVDHLIQTGAARVDVVPVDTRWFGVTYREDKPTVTAAIEQMIADGIYPARLADA